jgi:hypothetical protein
MIAQITIKKEVLKNFFDYLFEKKEGIHIIRGTTDIGKYLISRATFSDFPPRKIEDAINIQLPADGRMSRNRFVYYTKEDIHKINIELDAAFSIDFDRYYLQGLKLGLKRKDIIDSYINSRNMISFNCDHETLKKRKYREELVLIEKKQNYLLNLAKNRHSTIDVALREYASK